MNWTGAELAYLRQHAKDGRDAIARELGRSPASVESTAHRIRISLRRPGSRRGLVLGQPRGVALRGDLREDLVSGKVSADVLAARVAIDAGAELCPRCVARPATVTATGLCRVCHLHALADAHREALSEIEARRDLWQARQELKRARDRAPA